MAANKYPYQCPAVICNGTCGGERVEWTFSVKQVKVAACSALKAQGWTGVQAVFFPDEAEAHIQRQLGTGLRHRDGLVIFA